MGGYAVSQVRPEYVGTAHGAVLGMIVGFGFGGLLIMVDGCSAALRLFHFSGGNKKPCSRPPSVRVDENARQLGVQHRHRATKEDFSPFPHVAATQNRTLVFFPSASLMPRRDDEQLRRRAA
jgi:hypothetical protein